ncbi:MAG: AbiV family abortive infection protein [Candidatus Thorarchaeota archaeon]
MISREVYEEAMHESLRNAKALIREAVLVGREISSTHALLLKNTAIEEIAKAYACWLVVAKVVPRNYSLIRPGNRKGVFRDHDAKYTMYIGLHSSLIMHAEKAKKSPGEKVTQEELLGAAVGATIIGPTGTKKRFEWMYVDIRKNQEGKWFVSSPLKQDKGAKLIDFRGVKTVVRYVEHLTGFMKRPEFEEYQKEMIEWFRENDSEFPREPKW